LGGIPLSQGRSVLVWWIPRFFSYDPQISGPEQ